MKLGQQMRLARRMIQSMEILQMPIQALEERIEQELESNIALETVEPGGDERTLEQIRMEQDREDTENERELRVEDGGGGAEDFERLDSFESTYADAAENEFTDSDKSRQRNEEYVGAPSRSSYDGERDAKLDAMANTEARAESPVEQLLEQWAFADVDEDLREPGRVLISHIEDDGFIRTPLAKIASDAPAPRAVGGEREGSDGPGPEEGKRALTVERLERALLAVQMFLDPPGIGARDVRESLLLQLDALMEESRDESVEHARLLIESHMDDLVHNRLPRIAQRTGLTIDQINGAVEQMRRLTLHPGRRLVNATPPTIVPDAIVEHDDDADQYVAYLTDGRIPNLRLNREYALMARDRAVPKNDRDFIRTNLNNAQWLIEAVRQRRQTLLRVINVVVAAQRDFFDQGPQALRPLPMTQVADQLGIHVATVSRAVAGKHLQTPRGVFALRKFFSGGTQTEGGEDVSWEAVRAAMQEVVDAEDKKKPLSDDAIAKAMKERGIDIARRTVAKYRGQLNIPPARLRKAF